MKKLKLQDLKVNSFTVQASKVRGGALPVVDLPGSGHIYCFQSDRYKDCRPSFDAVCWESECPTSCCTDEKSYQIVCHIEIAQPEKH